MDMSLYEHDPGFVLEMLRGSVPTSIGAFGFMITLSRTTKRFGMHKSFMLSIAVCLVIILVGVYIL